jgi:hypothetical protein
MSPGWPRIRFASAGAGFYNEGDTVSGRLMCRCNARSGHQRGQAKWTRSTSATALRCRGSRLRISDWRLENAALTFLPLPVCRGPGTAGAQNKANVWAGCKSRPCGTTPSGLCDCVRRARRPPYEEGRAHSSGMGVSPMNITHGHGQDARATRRAGRALRGSCVLARHPGLDRNRLQTARFLVQMAEPHET